MDLSEYYRAWHASPTTDPMPVYVKGATRADFPAFLREQGYRKGAEIGVYKGEYAELLCQGIPGLKLYGIDAWTPFIGADGRHIYRSTAWAYPEAIERLKPYDCELIKGWSAEVVQTFDGRSLDFVYIDADHRLPYCLDDIAAWSRIVRSGGVVAGHDWEERPNKHNHVSLAVRAWAHAFNISPWFVLGRWKRLRDEPCEEQRTWFWVVP